MTERPTHPKSTCCIPGCPRWSRKFEPGAEWMCGRHWRSIPRRVRRAFVKVEQRINDLGSLSVSTGWDPDDHRRWVRSIRLSDRLWAHGRRRVILREAGL